MTAGTRLGPYEILAPLGAGGMGEVYRAKDTRLDRTVAIEILSLAGAADPEFRDSADQTGRDLLVLPLNPPGSPRPLIRTVFSEESADISPDGRWIAYESTESGAERNIFVRPFPDIDAGKWQVSSAGAWSPMWSRNSRELFYRSSKDFFVVGVPSTATSRNFAFDKPRVLFQYQPYLYGAMRTYDISLDGTSFLMVKPSTPQAPPPSTFMVVTHWFDELRAKVTGR